MRKNANALTIACALATAYALMLASNATPAVAAVAALARATTRTRTLLPLRPCVDAVVFACNEVELVKAATPRALAVATTLSPAMATTVARPVDIAFVLATDSNCVTL